MFIPPFLQIIQRRGKCRPFRYFTTLGQMCNITVNVEHEDECNLKEIFAKKQIFKKCQTSDSRLVWLVDPCPCPVGCPPKNFCFNLLIFLNQNFVYMWATTNTFKGKGGPFRYFTTSGQMCNIAVNEEHVFDQWPPFTHFALYHATICRIVQNSKEQYLYMAIIINFFTAIFEQILNVSSKKFCKQIILKICKTSDSKLVWCCDFVHNIIHLSMSMSMCQTPSLSNKDAKKWNLFFHSTLHNWFSYL